MKTDLSSLYSYYDYLKAAPLDADGCFINEEMNSKSGHRLDEIAAMLSYLNPRFNLAELQAGKRLTPIAVGPDRLAVEDDRGIQICVGDVLEYVMDLRNTSQRIIFSVDEEVMSKKSCELQLHNPAGICISVDLCLDRADIMRPCRPKLNHPHSWRRLLIATHE